MYKDIIEGKELKKFKKMLAKCDNGTKGNLIEIFEEEVIDYGESTAINFVSNLLNHYLPVQMRKNKELYPFFKKLERGLSSIDLLQLQRETEQKIQCIKWIG